MQKKNEFVYQIFKSFPNPPYNQFSVGNLTFQIQTKESTFRGIDDLFITWQCNMEGTGTGEWYACRPEVKLKNYELMPLLKKMEKANINSSSTPSEIIDFLHANKITQALHTKLYKDYREIFSGRVSVSEIVEGNFKRTDAEYNIPAEQQERLMDEIMKSKQITPPKQAAA
jgi:hypothetical protein